jgi:hypothetical protein
MAIDGMALALRLRERWPTTLLNQTHPKVLIPTLGGERYADASPEAAIAWFGRHSGLDVSGVWNGHELDALLSAWAIRQGPEQGVDRPCGGRSRTTSPGRPSEISLA